MIFHSDAGESIRVSLRGRTFIGARIIIGKVQIKTEDLLGTLKLKLEVCVSILDCVGKGNQLTMSL